MLSNLETKFLEISLKKYNPSVLPVNLTFKKQIGLNKFYYLSTNDKYFYITGKGLVEITDQIVIKDIQS